MKLEVGGVLWPELDEGIRNLEVMGVAEIVGVLSVVGFF
jgi:hypothetical protein